MRYISIVLLVCCIIGCFENRDSGTRRGNILAENTGGRAPSGNHSVQGVLKEIIPCGINHWGGTFIFKLEKGKPNPTEYILILKIRDIDNYEFRLEENYLFIISSGSYLIKALDELDQKEKR
jgi:hypothetical protein